MPRSNKNTSPLTVKQDNCQPTLTLASGSPRRREILSQAGFIFNVVPSRFSEDMTLSMPPGQLAEHLSYQKALEAARCLTQGTIVLSADTFIAFEGRLLGKPRDAADAIHMLESLSGRTHEVITGFTVLEAPEGSHAASSHHVTRVTFRALGKVEIEAYVATGEPLDKAGAYGIQEQGRALVEHIEGDFLNIAGLPLSAVKDALEKFGIFPEAHTD